MRTLSTPNWRNCTGNCCFWYTLMSIWFKGSRLRRNHRSAVKPSPDSPNRVFTRRRANGVRRVRETVKQRQCQQRKSTSSAWYFDRRCLLFVKNVSPNQTELRSSICAAGREARPLSRASPRTGHLRNLVENFVERPAKRPIRSTKFPTKARLRTFGTSSNSSAVGTERNCRPPGCAEFGL